MPSCPAVLGEIGRGGRQERRRRATEGERAREDSATAPSNSFAGVTVSGARRTVHAARSDGARGLHRCFLCQSSGICPPFTDGSVTPLEADH